ncbi:MAG: TonB-dependent receptor [Acidobacteria bacterium]|nr:TonB-dependent receptor [Acidobacteriota bacterium]
MKAVRTLLTGVLASMLAVLVVLSPANAAAQALYGTLTGTVVDDSGAAIPGATVTVVNQGTGLEVNAVTDDTGSYAIRNLQPGAYTVKASLQGFKEYVQTGIPVSQGDVVRIVARLEVGALTESVTVTTEAALLKTDKADVSVNLRPAEVVNLPLNQYRNYQALLNLVPGATPTGVQNDQTDTPGRALTTNVNGTNRNNNVTRVDGAASINVWLPHHAGYIAPAETVETVNVSTTSFDASQGMTGGAAMSVVTKSGTNELKGSAFYFRNNSSWNARQNYFSANDNPKGSLDIMGGTVGGPIKKNHLFFFGGYERNLEKNSSISTLTVPTARMRQGDFSEVLAVNPNFRLYDPATGDATAGTGRSEFANAIVPANRISPISQAIQAFYPLPNVPGTNGGIQNNYEVARFPVADRHNYDIKVNWNRSAQNQIWGKFSMMDANVESTFFLPFEDGLVGDTNTKIFSFGQTYTLTPTLIWDATFGANRMAQNVIGPDFGTNYGLDQFGIPGTNSAGASGPGSADLLRYSGFPTFNTGMSTLGNSNTWTPVWRDEASYTFSTNVTKVAGKHEIRAGFDFVRLTLDHWQPEDANPRGNLDFGSALTGAAGYSGNAWNQYAAFLLGTSSGFSKSIQYQEMTARENQLGFYINDRWQVNDKLTLNYGLRYEYYPLMSRDGQGLEFLDLNTFNTVLGGVGSNSQDLGIKVSKTLFAPRLGAAYRLNDDTVLRAGFGRTFNPMPWARPLRGFYPFTIAYSAAGNTAFTPYTTLANGLPAAPTPVGIESGVTPLPRGVSTRWADPDNVERGTIDSWNVFVERRLPMDVALGVGYVGTATNDGFADVNVNYAESGGNANRQYFAQAGNATLREWGSITKARYHSLQVSLNRPFKNGLLLKGAYTFSKALNETDDDGWATLMWSQPSQIDRNYARAGYDRPHMLQLGFVYELPFARESSGVLAQVIKNWQINGIGSIVSGVPFTVAGDNSLLNQQAGQQTANVTGELSGGFGTAGPNETWYDVTQFSQPGNAWGNSGRNTFRGPANWNLDFSVFRAIPISRYRLELRAEASNVFNHAQWGTPVTGITDPNFMRIRSFTSGSLVRSPRRVQLGIRFQF